MRAYYVNYLFIALILTSYLELKYAFIVRSKHFNGPQFQHCKANGDIVERSFEVSKNDIPLYAALAGLQVLPPLAIIDLPEPIDSIRKGVSYFYFITTACLAVYLGAKRQDIKQTTSPLSKKSAVFAPVVSSVFLFGFYLLLKYTDIEVYFGKIYQISGTVLGITCIDVIVTSILGSQASESQNEKVVNAEIEQDPATSMTGFVSGAVLAAGYIAISNFGGHSPEALCALSFFNNVIALSIAVFSIGIIRVESFAVACAFLVGLFFYDIFWVFGTDVMMTVATKIEAPVKFLFPANPALMSTRPYPFSVLGLGDIVVPGVMAVLARRIDENGISGISSGASAASPSNASAPAPAIPSSGRLSLLNSIMSMVPTKPTPLPQAPTPIADTTIRNSYLDASMGGYAFGLLLAFTANEVTKAGQPALLYLVPSVISAMLITASRNNALGELWGQGLGLGSNEKKFNDS